MTINFDYVVMVLAVMFAVGGFVAYRRAFKRIDMTEKALEEWRQRCCINHQACPQCAVGSYVCEQHAEEFKLWSSTARWVRKSRPEAKRLSAASTEGSPFAISTKLP